MIVTLTGDVKINPKELAIELADMCDYDQAVFINELQRQCQTWTSDSADYQLKCVMESAHLDSGSRCLLKSIASAVDEHLS